MKLKIYKTLVLIVFVGLAFAQNTLAHTTQTGSMNVRIDGSTINTTIVLPEERFLDNAELFDTYVNDAIYYLVGSSSCPHEVVSFETAATTTIGLRSICEQEVMGLTIDSIFLLDDGYEFYVYVEKEGGAIQQALIGPEKVDASFEFLEINEDTSDTRGSFLTTIKMFVWEGMKHIYIGIDHVLFVLVLIILARTTKQVLVLVTAFTIAHSITLILAAQNIIVVSSSIVEPIIALSIALVAFELSIERGIQKVLKKDIRIQVAHLWYVVFGLGLFHGLGFASVLRELSIPEEYLLSSLLSFNVGVELGQLTIVLVVFPLLMLLRKYFEHTYAKCVEQTALWFSGTIAICWFVERVFLG